MGWLWGQPGRRRGGPFRGGRMFEQGDLKYVILQLLDEKPRHGYDIIKELEERSGGTYSPSPGTV
jgi:DNA-binding PadR family transcriptional regulator